MAQHQRYTNTYHSINALTTEAVSTYVQTIDDQHTRVLTGVFLSVSTPGLSLQLLVNGQVVSQWDASQFSAAGSYLHVHEEYPKAWYFEFRLVNTTNAPITNVGVGFQYTIA